MSNGKDSATVKTSKPPQSGPLSNSLKGMNTTIEPKKKGK